MNGSTKTTDKREVSLFELKFIVIPRFLVFLLHVCLVMTMLVYACLGIIRDPSTGNALLVAILVIAGYIASKMAQGGLAIYLVRKRLWLWGKDKFKTWDEFRNWVKEKSPREIETILIAEDAKRNAGTLIKDTIANERHNQ